MHSAAWVVELCDLYINLMTYFLIDQLVHHLSTDYMYHQQDVSLLLTLLCESLNLLDHHFWMYVFVDLNERFHFFLLYVLKHFFNFNLMYHYFKTDLAQTCIRRYFFDSKIVFLQCFLAVLHLDLKYQQSQSSLHCFYVLMRWQHLVNVNFSRLFHYVFHCCCHDSLYFFFLFDEDLYFKFLTMILHWWWYVDVEHKMTLKWCHWLHAHSLRSAVNVFSLLHELFFKSARYLFQSLQLILHALIDSQRSDALTRQLFYHLCQTFHLSSEHQFIVFTFVELIEYSQLV